MSAVTEHPPDAPEAWELTWNRIQQGVRTRIREVRAEFGLHPQARTLLFRGEIDYAPDRPLKSQLQRTLECHAGREVTPAELRKAQERDLFVAHAHLPERSPMELIAPASVENRSRFPRHFPYNERHSPPPLGLGDHLALTLDLDLLARLQHMGRPTFLLDATSDLNVALFFACWKDHGTDGCIKAFPHPGPDTSEPLDHPRVQAQRSHLLSGQLQPLHPKESWRTWRVPARHKQPIIQYLWDAFAVCPATLFPDLPGAMDAMPNPEELLDVG